MFIFGKINTSKKSKKKTNDKMCHEVSSQTGTNHMPDESISTAARNPSSFFLLLATFSSMLQLTDLLITCSTLIPRQIQKLYPFRRISKSNSFFQRKVSYICQKTKPSGLARICTLNSLLVPLSSSDSVVPGDVQLLILQLSH